MALIYKADSIGSADATVFEVGSQGLADLLVWRTEDQGLARGDDGVWCFVNSSGLASSRIWFADSGGLADLAICFVSSRGLCGWRRSHRLFGRL